MPSNSDLLPHLTAPVQKGDSLAILGRNGSGKSTLGRCLSRLVEPTAGDIILDGENLLEKSAEELIEIRRHKMGMVFQSFGLMPHLNVIDNIAFPLKLQGIEKADRYAQAERVIELVGLQGRENNFPNELSGGQQQRVGIARSLAVEPDIWLLDAPFSASTLRAIFVMVCTASTAYLPYAVSPLNIKGSVPS